MSNEQQGDDSTAEIDDDDDDDLKILNELIIDQDLNPWSEFRASIAFVSQSRGGDDSLQSLFTQSSTISAKSSKSPTACVVLVDEKQLSEKTIADEQEVVSNDIQGNAIVSEAVAFSKLTPMEQHDMQSWNNRLSREKVFSRYYNPKWWELSELKTIQKSLT